jgi:hypothetical protein
MREYQPIDLTRLCNAGVGFIGANASPPIGPQTFHGLPFRIGTRPTRCFIGFNGPKTKPRNISIPVRKKARHVIFVHALLESRVGEGEPVGQVIAHYLFRLRDNSEKRVPIRERFEINIVPTGWGQSSFLSLPDQKNSMQGRYEGRWDAAGRRQTEVQQGWPLAYYLWAWKNPQPESLIDSILIEPADRKFLVAAITLGQLDEPPFTRTGARPVKISLLNPRDAARPFDLEVEVDRGMATYPYPLPKNSAAEFQKDGFKGWGERLNPASSPAYVEVAAIPSATITVRNGGKKVGQTRWGTLQKKGRLTLPRMRLEIVDRGKNWVHVTVLDDASNKPIPCRIHFRSPEGIPYQPHGHHNHVYSNLNSWHKDIGGDLRLGQISYAYIDGTCQGWLPRGDLLVDVARGFEYEPLRAKVRIERGQRELTLRLKRWTDLNANRWFSGDTHVHFLGTQGAHREAQGEDLNVVNLLQSQWGSLFTNTEDWIGRPTMSHDGKTIVYCTQENRQHMLGHLTLLGLKKPVMPWCSDGPGEAEMAGTLDVTLSHWADACHKQGGTVVIPHLPNPNGETAVLIATGRGDAVEMIDFSAYKHLEYYRYLNCGYRLPLVGGTDKMSSEVPVGLYRTYAYIPENEKFDYDAWLKAVRAGRTFLSGGPILQLTVNGAQVGDTVRLTGNGGTVQVEAWTESTIPIHSLEIIQQGKIVASTGEKKGARRLQLKASLKINGHTWLAARCGGPKYAYLGHHDSWRRGLFAHTSPIYIAVGDNWWMFDKDAAEYMLTLVSGGLSYIRHMAPHHPPDHVTHHHDEEDHLAYLERPFHEAADAIHRRMHQLGIPH